MKNHMPETGVAAPPVLRLLPPPQSWPPTLVVVIDTEEEFDWDAPFNPSNVSVANIELQALAQNIFDTHGVVPTYVIDYPVATTPASVAILSGFADEGRCEIGAHLHPWVNPPAEGPVDAWHSYPGNLPAAIERRKLIALTAAITANFNVRPTVYKAGRYGFGAATPAILRELDYTVDVSLVPHTNFSRDGGPDFTGIYAAPFLITEHLCEIPLSVHFAGQLAYLGPMVFPVLLGRIGRLLRLPGVCGRLRLLERLRLSPEGHSLKDLMRQTWAALAGGTRLFMLTYHSSSMLPGATAYVRDESDRTAFLATLDGYLRFFLGQVGGRVDTVARAAAALMQQSIY
jgi:hypothetical protein